MYSHPTILRSVSNSWLTPSLKEGVFSRRSLGITRLSRLSSMLLNSLMGSMLCRPGKQDAHGHFEVKRRKRTTLYSIYTATLSYNTRRREFYEKKRHSLNKPPSCGCRVSMTSRWRWRMRLRGRPQDNPVSDLVSSGRFRIFKKRTCSMVLSGAWCDVIRTIAVGFNNRLGNTVVPYSYTSRSREGWLISTAGRPQKSQALCNLRLYLRQRSEGGWTSGGTSK